MHENAAHHERFAKRLRHRSTKWLEEKNYLEERVRNHTSDLPIRTRCKACCAFEELEETIEAMQGGKSL